MTKSARQTVVFGVTGGIGAYKACEIVRTLVRCDYRVKVVMTEAAARFVGPLTFRTLTGEPVTTSLWDDASGDPVHHVSLAREAAVMMIAPCTADVLAKMAHGVADDMLTTTVLATDAPVVIAPAMNDRMWLDEVTQDNVRTLTARGVVIVGPETGDLACGDTGIGRLADVTEIVETIVREAERVRSLEGVRFLVTAGGTREAIDPVRFLGNPASGKTGIAVADEAARRGAEVTLVVGPTWEALPPGVESLRVVSAEEMRDAVMERVASADVVVMTAAVTDYRPAEPSETKIKKAKGEAVLRLVRTPDILAEVGGLPGDRVLVGFAAETKDVVANARVKLDAKGADMIVANDVSDPGLGFGSDTNRVVFVTTDGEEETPVLSKKEIAGLLLDRVAVLLGRE